METKNLESAAAELMATLNEAIKAGVDNLPGAGTLALESLGTLFAAQAMISAAWIVISFPFLIAGTWFIVRSKRHYAAYKHNNESKVWRSELDLSTGHVVIGALFICFGVVIFLVASLVFSGKLSMAISPLGYIISKSL